MNTIKKQRGPVRVVFTKALNEVKAELDKDDADKLHIQQLFSKLKVHRDKLAKLDEAIEAQLLGSDATEEDFAAEYESATGYQDKFIEMEINVNVKLITPDMDTEPAGSVEGGGADGSRRSKYRLPKLEFKKFSGEPREWLGFWSQFKSIHEDEGMAAGEKFQYLVQCTVEKSKAREVIDSFPPSAENYPKVIEYLKSRFGREDVLVEVYVRDLLRLVVSNTIGKDRMSIANLYDKLETQLRPLDTLGVTSDKYAAMLYPLVESSLPEETLRAWERNRSVGHDPTKNKLIHLMEFLRTEVDSEIRIKMAQTGFGEEKKTKVRFQGQGSNSESVPTATDLYQNGQFGNKQKLCIFCDKAHESGDCFKAGKMTLDEKKKIVQNKRACYVCLKVGHVSSKCFSKIRCSLCGKRHLTIMCPEHPSHVQRQQQVVPVQKDTSMANHSTSGAILQTIVVRLISDSEERIVRALFDSGSTQSYITEKAVQVLGFTPVGKMKVTHSLFGGQETPQQIHGQYEVKVQSKNRKFVCTLPVMDSPKICGIIPRASEGPWMAELRKAQIDITDVGEDVLDIHLLIGADLAATLFTGKMYPTRSGPVAMETKLGWTLWGKGISTRSPNNCSLLVTSLHISDASIQELWNLDVIGIRDPVETKSDKELVESAQKHFLETVCVNKEGRYEVSLPWIEGHPPLTNNRAMAEQRLRSSLKRLQDMNKVQNYKKIFEEWEGAGIIERVLEEETSDVGWYLPHRPVFKPSSLTTPIRPVFDASAKSKNSPALNDCLEKGPNLIELVPDILIRFRKKKYGAVSDVAKAFLQISVRKQDRDNLRFLWWEKDQLKTYRHCRVVFGVSSSPFLLAATINYHLDGAGEEFRETAQLLKRSLYVDNCIVSLDNENDLSKFIRESTKVMEKAKFDLRGWIWTDKEEKTVEVTGVSSLPNSECGLVTDSFGKEKQSVVPVLGMLWNIKKDTLSLDLAEVLNENDGPVTKRSILSAAHRIFDPIGFSSPVSLVPKLILQDVWKLKLGWDEPVPDEMKTSFQSWMKTLDYLKKIEIPRWMVNGPWDERRCSLHVFTDASLKAYSACVFIRYEDGDQVNVQLVMARARVASTKKMTIPRLELLGCCIGARLAVKVKEILESKDIRTFYWTDSSNSLFWIQKHENWATFVYNRVAEIRKLSNSEDWRHIPGENNPADLPSRGCSARHLLASRWWEGPNWMKLEQDEWPKSNVQSDMETVMSERVKSVTSQLALEQESKWYVQYFSKYRKIVRMVAWMLRFPKKLKKAECYSGPLNMQEEQEAELALLRIVQTEAFNNESRVITQLNAEKDEDGIWRVKTKIIMREDFKDFKFPILLPFGHKITTLMLEHEHRKNHCGVQVLMMVMRERFWIVKSRKMARQVVMSCDRCKRFTVKNVTPIEAPLPMDRVREANVFEVIGIDLGGPLYLKNNQKGWFVVFTCAVYRAVHLDLVTSLSTEGFLQALRRFISRRGRPYTIYTDNGTNFEGASNFLKKLDWEKITTATAVEQIRWKFNPPSAPWWGGWWERIVGMVKKLLRSILGRASLDYEELQTLLCDCEATINSRPLTYVSEDIDDLVPLTPAMFLYENRSSGVPDIDAIDSAGLNRRFQLRQKLREDIRRRFRDEYLGFLVHRNPVKANNQSVKVGDVVLVGSDNMKRIQWPMARVLEVIPGRDGVVRTVKLKTSKSEIVRPVQRVYPLEMASEDDFILDKFGVEMSKEVEGKEKVVVTRFGRRVKRPKYLLD